jgi:hypothetical protein
MEIFGMFIYIFSIVFLSSHASYIGETKQTDDNNRNGT